MRLICKKGDFMAINVKLDRTFDKFISARQLLTLLSDIKNDARAAISCSVDCPILLGAIHDTEGYPLPSVPAAFYCEGNPRILVNLDCNVLRSEENLCIEVWHEVGHLAVYAKDPERYRYIHRLNIPKSLDYTALNLFELVPRMFSLAKRLPTHLFDLVLSDTFANAAKEFCETPAIAASVLATHQELCLGVPQHQLTADLRWDGILVQGETTKQLALLVEEELAILRESQVFAPVLAALKKQGAYKGALT